ncbi:hypothetical protein SDC9_158100 [bioreactor metagenome]|uniref:Uncharacterized protein n=1 Tax=bioreactor metagenome TaxID=1076179 RepID=A0A645FEI9_9ZZZZ
MLPRHQREVFKFPNVFVFEAAFFERREEVFFMDVLIAHDAEAETAVADVFYGLHRVRLMVFEVYGLLPVKGLCEFCEGVGGIARARQREAEGLRSRGLVKRFELVYLYQDVARVFKEARPLRCRHDALGGAVEYGDIHILLKFADSLAQMRLSHK